ncbi:MAG: hypothetical protein AB8B79_22420 [Granulosicoccus sp.]
MGVYTQHALVLAHRGASAAQSWLALALADALRADMAASFGVQLPIEPLVI